MAHRILIVDDDQEFNGLLCDVFEQADYSVVSCNEANAAMERLKAGDIDLLVTDFRMPGPSGLDMITSIRKHDEDLPIIMVSAYLENSMIRELIERGVGGIFMKPLNIFSLLKRAEHLIRCEEAREEEGKKVPVAGYGANLGFVFRAYPCRDPRSREFAKRLYDLRAFSKNLLLVAEIGTDLRTICEDLVSYHPPFGRLRFYDATELSEESIRSYVEQGASDGSEGGVTIAVARAEQLSAAQRQVIYELARATGRFAHLVRPVRFVFCLDRELDEYYDAGRIDEAFYLFLGTSEVRVPSLRQIPDDLGPMAEMLLAREAPDKDLESAARAYLARQTWNGNMEEFGNKLKLIARLARDTVISLDHVRKVVERSETEEDAPEDGDAAPLEAWLRQRRDDFISARTLLSQCGREPNLQAPA